MLLLAVLAGCGPAVGTQASTDGSTSMSADASTTASSNASSTSTTSVDVSSTSSTSSGGDSSSTGEALEGPGCGIVPTCTDEVLDRNVGVASLEDLEAIAGVTDIAGDLQVASPDLVCLDVLACLRRVGGEVRILENEALRSTAGLAAVDEVGYAGMNGSSDRGVVVANNPVLQTLEGFDALVAINDGLVIWDNPALEQVTGFGSLKGLQLLSVANNPILESLQGLQGLLELHDCNVNQNASLCISEVFEVCGDVDPVPDGVTNGNDDGC
ncbi:MAG: hypothetical protein AAGA54_09570 [Myxococcota bacterium]